MVAIYAHAKGQRSVSSKVRVETDGQMEAITATGNSYVIFAVTD